MKRKISDILDDYQDDSVVLDLDTPLSSRRIKELTMSRMKAKRSLRYKAVRLIAVAAIISVLAVTAFGAENAVSWFRGFFADNAGGELSQGQIDFIDSNVREENQGETIGRYHVMLESFISDGGMAHVRIAIQGFDGAVATEDYYTFREMDIATMDGENVSTGLVWGKEEVLEETNTAVYLLSFDCAGLSQVEGDLTVRLELTDLFNASGERLVEGIWEFDIQLTDVSVEVFTESVSGALVFDEAGNSIQITVTSICLRPMGLRIRYEQPEADGIYHPGMVRVIMRDGTVHELIPSAWGRESEEPDAPQWVEYTGGILVAEEISSVILPGEVEIPVIRD